MNEIKQTSLKPVAVIGSGWQLFYVGTGSIASIVYQHSLKIGDVLYAGALPAASADMAEILEIISADADAGEILLTSGIRMVLDAALIKAGRKEAPVRTGE